MLGWIVRVVLLCFVVGLVLSFLDIDPTRILTDSWTTAREVAALSLGVIRWAVPYILIGAVIVVPLSLLGVILRWSRNRGRP